MMCEGLMGNRAEMMVMTTMMMMMMEISNEAWK